MADGITRDDIVARFRALPAAHPRLTCRAQGHPRRTNSGT